MFITFNTEDKMDILLKNENVYAQNSASHVKSAYNKDEIASLLSIYSPSTPQSMNIENTLDTLSMKNPCMKHKTLLTAASKINSSDAPRCHFLKCGIQTLTDKLAIRDLKLKTARQTVKRQIKKIATVKTTIRKLQKQNLIH